MERDRGHGARPDEPGGCAAFGPLLEAYYHQALEPDQTRSVANHAARCDLCRATLERFAATDRLIALAPAPAPGPELRERLAARITLERARPLAGTAASHPITRETVVHDMSDVDDPQRRNAVTQVRRGGRGMQRMRVWLGTVAAVLVVALLAGALLTRMHGPTVGSGTATPTPGNPNLQSTPTPDQGNYANSAQFAKPAGACNPAQIKAQIPVGTLLFDIAMVSPDEGWAVGAIEGQADPIGSVMLHYQHCAWTPIVTSYPGATLMSVSMTSATEGWAVGGSSDGKQLALHYTGGTWQRVRLPGENTFNGVYQSVHMRSANEGWLVVLHSKDQYGVTHDNLLHLVNGQWSAVDSPFQGVSDVLPIAQNEAWVAGFAGAGQARPILYHYQTGKWTGAALPSGIIVDRLRMVSPSDIWASGHISAPSNWDPDQSAAVLHYDGDAWQQVTTGASGHPQFIQAFDRNTNWAFTIDPNMEPEAIHSTQYERGGTWLRVKWPYTYMGMGTLSFGMNPMQRVSTDEYWTIGVTGPSRSVLLYFASGTWHQYGR